MKGVFNAAEKEKPEYPTQHSLEHPWEKKVGAITSSHHPHPTS